jgi:hypothetical protein
MVSVSRSNSVACLQQPFIFSPTRPIKVSESPVIQLRIVTILPEEWVMKKSARRSEQYREKAAKYNELAKRACPPYLGEFYRGIAVRYGAMAQDVSQHRNGLKRPLMRSPGRQFQIWIY